MMNWRTDLRLIKSILAGILSFTVALLLLFNVNAIISFSRSYPTSLKTIPSVSSTNSTPIELPLATEPCRQLLGADDVLVIVKTGANMEEEFEGHYIHDVLSGVSAEMKKSAPEFNFYRDLHENQDRLTEFMRQNATAQRKAWHIDKWKFLPAVEKALQAKPDAKWFMFMEADTFLVWSNLLKWLAKLDWRRPYFLGQPVTMEGQLFAYGGAGWLLSRPAIQQMADHMASRNSEYEYFTNGTSFGDLILGYVLEQAGVGLTGAWPLIQRETPSTMEYTRDVWCHPAVTFHHIDALEIKSIWDLEQRWIANMQGPLLHFDIFNHLIYPLLATKIVDWDNFSDGEEKFLTPNEGFEDCKLHCEEDMHCMQFRFTPKKCTLSHSITLGWKADRSMDSMSGWMMERITQAIASVRLWQSWQVFGLWK
ncbi:Glycoprotein-N-acetylgalactosamine 3-beta-galactosyltransferase 1-A [Aspergillus fumigatus Z5]|nr:Glycoprotein-N-acetylgalactosamine 3-beta-galactosyltransferase 1-A [Aspergillus fumigatus Z5]